MIGNDHGNRTLLEGSGKLPYLSFGLFSMSYIGKRTHYSLRFAIFAIYDLGIQGTGDRAPVNVFNIKLVFNDPL